MENNLKKLNNKNLQQVLNPATLVNANEVKLSIITNMYFKEGKKVYTRVNSNICLFELAILIIGIISFAWIAGDYKEIPINKELIGEIVKSFDIIPGVSAQAINSGKCCLSAKNGASCQDFSAGSCDSQCDGRCLSTSCSQVAECKLGCSIDTNEGLCTPNSLKSECESSQNCEWVDDISCNVEKCSKGCCKLGLNAQFVTEQRCRKLSQLYGVQNIFQQGGDEAACIDSLNAEEKGACVFGEEDENEERVCKFTTKINCQGINGEFHKDYLCSNVELKTVCEKQKSTNCAEGLDGVYWFDSCGNMENIYSSDKDKSWNNGRAAIPSSICSSPSASCGNCNYELGSKCGLYRPGVDTKLRDGDYTCRDLNCENAPGHADTKKDRINGESWCVYDGQIGGMNLIPLPSADVVGSRHFRYICENGEVISEPCADYRQEICVQNTKKLSSGKQIDNAICRVNLWEQCLSLNGEKGCELGCLTKCTQNPDCRIFPVFVDSDFKFNECVPKYPPGFDLGSTSGAAGIGQGAIGSQLGNIGGQLGGIASSIGNLGNNEASGSDICNLGTKTCTVTYQKKCPGGWKCIKNCECESISFTTQLNNMCVSLGDCGAYTNIAGKTTFDGASVSKKGSKGKTPPSPMIISFAYALFANPIKNQKADPGFFDQENELLNLGLHGLADPFLSGYSRTGGGVSGGGGLFGGSLGTQLGVAGVTAVGVSVIASSVASVGALGGLYGIGGVGAIGQFGIGNFVFGIDPIGLAIVIAAVAITVILGCGKVEQIEIKFECKPWTRPYGGGTQTDKGLLSILGGGKKGCEFCNKDKLKPCTKYRCESLGMRCRLINENTGIDECIYDDKAVGIPIITPWEQVLNKTLFSYRNISTNGFQIRTAEGNCIQAFTALSFGVLTDEYAQCKISEENLKFEEMNEFFLEGNLFTKNHTGITSLPSVESIIAGETNSPEEFMQAVNNQTVYSYVLDRVGDINLHVKCANIDGQANEQDYRINFCVDAGPDLTAPIIMATAPPENSILAYSATEQFSAMFVNEPAECKWDKIKPETTDMTLAYLQLANTMSCATNVNDRTLLGYLCNATLPIYSNESKFYVLCRDQPWLGENSSRNYGAFNSGVYEYKLVKSQTPLKIDFISPSGNITRGVEPITIEISAGTSGGKDSNANCKYKLDNYPELIKMQETGGSEHKQILNQMVRGEYILTVNCTDDAGNNAEGTSTFKLELDTTAPEITRIYYQSGNLVVLTTEDSECAYVHNDSLCGFAFESGNKMESDLSMMHTAEWKSNKIYNVLCRDSFGNRIGGCSANIMPRTFPTT